MFICLIWSLATAIFSGAMSVLNEKKEHWIRVTSTKDQHVNIFHFIIKRGLENFELLGLEE